PGPYDYSLAKTGQQNSRSTQTSLLNGTNDRIVTPTRQEDAKTRKRREAEERQALSKKRKTRQKLIDSLEKKIMTLEKRQVEITALLELPETYSAGGEAPQLNRELMDISATLDDHNKEWSEAVDALNAIV
ncbi:MAG TPA: ABC transporter C-terminal domain-containing protein, partial [Verrucomicrobiota bacterium]|nr:ABC transporter C-terminal domain-containing protein [Verrucomicrobiota bacterium]